MAKLLKSSIFLDDIYCSYCNNEDSMRYDYHEGSILCTSCGYIAHQRFIDFKAEYRIFSDDFDGVDPRRATGFYNENLADGGLGTYIETNQEKKNHYAWMQNPNSKHHEGVQKLKTWGQILGLESKIITAAIDNYEKILIKKKTISKNFEELLAGILFLTSRSENTFLNITDLENVTGKTKKKIKKCFWIIKKNCCKFNLFKKTSSKSTYFAKIFANKLNLPAILIEKIQKIGAKFEDIGLMEGKNPKNIASVIIYNETNCTEANKKTLKEIAMISEISVGTIKTTYEHLIHKLGDMEIQITEKESFEKILKDLEKLHF